MSHTLDLVSSSRARTSKSILPLFIKRFGSLRVSFESNTIPATLLATLFRLMLASFSTSWPMETLDPSWLLKVYSSAAMPSCSFSGLVILRRLALVFLRCIGKVSVYSHASPVHLCKSRKWVNCRGSEQSFKCRLIGISNEPQPVSLTR